MKKLTLFFILLFSALFAMAQGDSYNFNRYSIALSAGVNKPYADLKQANQGKSFAIAGYYNLTPYIPLGLEAQFGDLSGGNIVTDPYKRQFKNNYKALIIGGNFGLGEIVDYQDNTFMHLIKDFYVGTGVGFINNNMTFIQRYNLDGSAEQPPGTYRFPGKDKSIELMVPLRFGIDLKLYNSYGEAFMSINLSYTHSVSWGEGLDGYTDPSSGFKNNAPDQYRQIMVGLKFNFGPTDSYLKAIN